MKAIWVILLALAIASTGTPSWSVPKSDKFVQDRFVIGFWVDPPADQITDARYKEIADANFTLVHGLFGPRTQADVKKQLKLCEKYGLKAIVRGDLFTPDTLPQSPACWGYHVIDEPGLDGLPSVITKVNEVRKYRPGKLAYFNLFPQGATAEQLGTTSYEEYISRFARETNCDVLSMDYYPLMTHTADDREGYIQTLAIMRKNAMEQGIPHWNFFNTMIFLIYNDPTEAQLRWQVMTSLAYGSKGVLYFCYWMSPGPGYPKGGALIAADGTKTRHYEQAKRINAGLKNWGPTLMKLTSLEIIRIKPGDDAAAKLKGTGIANITPNNPGADYLVGIFKHEDGRRVVLLNNYDPNYTIWSNVEFDVPYRKVRELDALDGKEKIVKDEGDGWPGFQISLDAGEGRLFLLPAK